MARRKKCTPERVVSLLPQIELAVAEGKTTVLAWKEAEITSRATLVGARSTAGCRWTKRGG